MVVWKRQGTALLATQALLFGFKTGDQGCRLEVSGLRFC